MDDGAENDVSSYALQNDPRIIVATTLATLLVAGSAYIWRSNPRRLVANSHHWLGESASRDPDSVVTPELDKTGSESAGSSNTKGSTTANNSRHNDENETKDSKVPRSKERRRRGKDPMKDIMKSVKKAKIFVRPTARAALDSEDSGPGQQPKANDDSTPAYHSSQANSSWSFSQGSNQRSPTSSLSPNSNSSSHLGEGDDDDEDDEKPSAKSSPSMTPKVVEAGTQPPTSLSTTLPDSRLLLDPRSPATTTKSRMQDPSSIHSQSQSQSALISPNNPPLYSSTRSSELVVTDLSASSSSSSAVSKSGNIPTPELTGHAVIYSSVPTSASLPAMNKGGNAASSSWDWDGTGPPSSSSTTYTKPPRFRPKSRSSSSSAASISPTTTSSVSLDTFPSPDSSLPAPSPPSFVSHVSPPPVSTYSVPADLAATASVFTSGELSPSCGFASSTSAPGYLPSNTVSNNNNNNNSNSNTSYPMGKPIYANGGEFAANGISSSNTPRRAPTPRRSPTPLSSTGTSTPPSSLSAQTQLASLKGALEAARIREEKTKADIEKLSRDLEAMRWESGSWRRREAELQTQVQYLMHQVQSYSALFSSVSGQPSPLNGNPNAASNPNAPVAPNGYPFSPSSAASPHSPPHLHIPAAQMLLANGMLPSPSILSPMSMLHSPLVSPFYPYIPHSPHPPPPQHVQQSQSKQQQQQQPKGLFPMSFSPNSSANHHHHHQATAAAATSTTESGPSSVAGSSSVGSGSPDLGGHVLDLPPGPLDRGRRRDWHGAGEKSGNGSAWEGEGVTVDGGWLVGGSSGEEVSPPFARCDDERSYPDNDNNDDDGEDDDEEGCVSPALADAILKRPGSIRGLSKKGKFRGNRSNERLEVYQQQQQQQQQQPAEFTFPSLSDLGNVNVNANRWYSAPQPQQPPVEGPASVLAPVDDDEGNDRAHLVRGGSEEEPNGVGGKRAEPTISQGETSEGVDSMASEVHQDTPG